MENLKKLLSVIPAKKLKKSLRHIRELTLFYTDIELNKEDLEHCYNITQLERALNRTSKAEKKKLQPIPECAKTCPYIKNK